MGRHAVASDELDDTFTILFVCTGNLHRSAMAERLTIAGMAPGTPVHVSSAGVKAVVGAPMGEHSATALVELGADPEGHVARQLSSEMIKNANLILTAETLHRDLVMAEVPASLRRTFTLLEFARLAAQAEPFTPDERTDGPALVARARAIGALRGQVLPPTQFEDIADPVHASLAKNRICATEILDAVRVLLTAMGLASNRQAAPGSSILGLR